VRYEVLPSVKSEITVS